MMQGVTPFRPENYEQGTSREWLVTNGLGGYASTTANGCNTRAYHGLLVAALQPPVDRKLLLSSLDEEVNGIGLANHNYPGVIHPQGFRYLQEFWVDPIPRLIYQVGKIRIEKAISMVNGENTTIISYKIQNGQGRMLVFPLVHSRNFHAASDLPLIRQEPRDCGTILQSSTKLTLFSDRARYVPKATIYYNFEYEEEKRRGLAGRENLFSPGYFCLELSGDTNFAIVASTWRTSMLDWGAKEKDEKGRLQSLVAPIPELARAADTFLVRRGSSLSLIAGYHWFDDWGRDAMIALPGLLLTTGRFREAKSVLKSFAGSMIDGVLPNDLGARSYNTVDASLWFIRAVWSYYQNSGDLEFVRQLWPGLLEVVRRYSQPGKDFGSCEDGLIVSGPALTWMDARVGGRPVTPRAGKCCEINALWYYALDRMEILAEALKAPGGSGFSESREKVRQSYNKFWNSETGCLYDVIGPNDASIRPNQIIGATFPDLLSLTKRKSILDVVTRDLLTPCGLRTLSPRDPRYVGRYEGDPRQRDEAYHQGTVWPWLMGPYIEAYISVNGRSDETRRKAEEILRPLLVLNVGGIDTIPEIFDGDPAQRPGGCIAQAWSVAEVLRAWAEAQE